MYITATGMVCAVGLNASASCVAMRAGIANFVELPYHDNQGEPIIGATVPDLPINLKRDERLVDLLAMALTDCLKDKPSEPLDRIPLLVGLAESARPGGGAELVARSIIERVQEKVGVQFHRKFSQVITKGHVSGFESLRVVRDLFKDAGIQVCLVCGVDSYINASSLLWLDQHWRLKTEENSDGVIPGEAAVAAFIEKHPSPKSSVEVTGLGFSHERSHVLCDAPFLGIGLASAAKTALSEAGLSLHQMDFRLSDVTGESYGFKEQSLVEARLLRIRKDELPLWHAAESIGDIGATAGIVQLMAAGAAFRKGYAPGEKAICYTSAVPGDRAVAVIKRYVNS